MRFAGLTAPVGELPFSQDVSRSVKKRRRPFRRDLWTKLESRKTCRRLSGEGCPRVCADIDSRYPSRVGQLATHFRDLTPSVPQRVRRVGQEDL